MNADFPFRAGLLIEQFFSVCSMSLSTGLFLDCFHTLVVLSSAGCLVAFFFAGCLAAFFFPGCLRLAPFILCRQSRAKVFGEIWGVWVREWKRREYVKSQESENNDLRQRWQKYLLNFPYPPWGRFLCPVTPSLPPSFLRKPAFLSHRLCSCRQISMSGFLSCS